MFTTATQVLDTALKGIDLSKLGERDVQETWVDSLLPASLALLQGTTGRDFGWHPNETIFLSGSGTDVIQVWKDDATLCAPIREVHELKIYDTVLSVSNLKVDSDQGIIGFWRGHVDPVKVQRMQRKAWFDAFPRDFHNVSVRLTWGWGDPDGEYPTPPELALAQAYATAALAMATYAGSVSAGLRSRRIEDFAEEYGRDGPYSAQVNAWSASVVALTRKWRVGRKHG